MLEVRRSTRGPQIFVSRRDKGFLRRLFELEVPEIHAGTVEIKAIAREAGQPVQGRRRAAARRASTRSARRSASAARASRRSWPSSAARRSTSSRGTTIRPCSWPTRCRPAQVLGVDIDEEHRIASVTVPERMLSLAIGREGQNARLAAKLTGWRIDIRSDVSVAEAKAARAPHRTRPVRPTATTPTRPRRPSPDAEAERHRAGRRARQPPSRAPRRQAGRRDARRRPLPRRPSRGRRSQAEPKAGRRPPTPQPKPAARSRGRPRPTEDRSRRRRPPRPGGRGRRRPPTRPPRRRRPRPRPRRPPTARWRRSRRDAAATARRSAAHRVPTRTCVACRTSRGRSASWSGSCGRPTGRIDRWTPRGRLAGRGAYSAPTARAGAPPSARTSSARALGVPLPDDRPELDLETGGDQHAEHTD